MLPLRRPSHPAWILVLAFVVTAALLLLFVEGALPFQDRAVGFARSEGWISWMAHAAGVLAIAAIWWAAGGDAWGGAVFANALNLGHETGQKLYGDLPWANLDTAMDLLVPLAVSLAVVWAWERRETGGVRLPAHGTGEG